MTTLTDFLLARIAEDEAGEGWGLPEFGPCYDCGGLDRARVLAECAAKRQIVERVLAEYDDFAPPQSLVLCDHVIEFLATPYADRPDYRAEWAL